MRCVHVHPCYAMAIYFLDPPSAPTTVSVQSTTYDSATIQWTAPSDNGGSDITGYNITISPPPSGSCSTGTCAVSGDTLQFIFTGLDHTQQYSISVAATNCNDTDGNATQLQPNLDIEATGKICQSIEIHNYVIVISSWSTCQ